MPSLPATGNVSSTSPLILQAVPTRFASTHVPLLPTSRVVPGLVAICDPPAVTHARVPALLKLTLSASPMAWRGSLQSFVLVGCEDTCTVTGSHVAPAFALR